MGKWPCRFSVSDAKAKLTALERRAEAELDVPTVRPGEREGWRKV
jgi:hypothetical protein